MCPTEEIQPLTRASPAMSCRFWLSGEWKPGQSDYGQATLEYVQIKTILKAILNRVF
jgi:hypothetical protein